MTERIYKLQPNRTLALRGFDQLGAAAALHAATANSFKVSGIFRDPADFAVLILWDADDFYEHPSIKYLPDFNFAGTILTFDAAYDAGLQPLDSPKYNWIDWATLDAIRADGTTAQVRLWDSAILQAGNFAAASGVFNFEEGTGVKPYMIVSAYGFRIWRTTSLLARPSAPSNINSSPRVLGPCTALRSAAALTPTRNPIPQARAARIRRRH